MFRYSSLSESDVNFKATPYDYGHYHYRSILLFSTLKFQ